MVSLVSCWLGWTVGRKSVMDVAVGGGVLVGGGNGVEDGTEVCVGEGGMVVTEISVGGICVTWIVAVG